MKQIGTKYNEAWNETLIHQPTADELQVSDTELLHDWKKSSKRSEFLKLFLYLCHIISEFCLFSIRNTKMSENADMAKVLRNEREWMISVTINISVT